MVDLCPIVVYNTPQIINIKEGTTQVVRNPPEPYKVPQNLLPRCHRVLRALVRSH